MMFGRLRNLAILGCLSFGSAVWAQSVISAKSGVINYTEGEVFAADQAVEVKNGKFPDWKKDQLLRTAEGRAEVLLTPGVFLRIAENSKLTLADTNEESASLLALQTRQQLSTTALSLASQADQNVLRLF